MNNVMKIMVLALAVSLSACASKDDTSVRNYRYAGVEDSCGETIVRETRPAPVRQVRYQEVQPVQVVQPAQRVQVANNCGGCQNREYTVRTPVKVVYKNTTYRTVYEPRTYESTSFETRPFSREEACTEGNCVVNGQRMVQQPTYVQQETYVQQPVQQPVQKTQVTEEVVYEK